MGVSMEIFAGSEASFSGGGSMPEDTGNSGDHRDGPSACFNPAGEEKAPDEQTDCSSTIRGGQTRGD